MTQDEYIKLTYDGLHVEQAAAFPTFEVEPYLISGDQTKLASGIIHQALGEDMVKNAPGPQKVRMVEDIKMPPSASSEYLKSIYKNALRKGIRMGIEAAANCAIHPFASAQIRALDIEAIVKGEPA